MHQLVWRSVADHEELPASLAKFEVPFAQLWDLAIEMKAALRKGENARPIVAVKTALRERLSQETFQSHQRVGDAMAMAGLKKGWSNVATELGEKGDAIRDRLNSIIAQRNKIVHEGHHERQDRPRLVKLLPVDQTEVKEHLDWLEKLIAAIAKVAEA